MKYALMARCNVGIEKVTFLFGTLKSDSGWNVMRSFKKILEEQGVAITDHGEMLCTENVTFTHAEIVSLEDTEGVKQAFETLNALLKELKRRDDKSTADFNKFLAKTGTG